MITDVSAARRKAEAELAAEAAENLNEFEGVTHEEIAGWSTAVSELSIQMSLNEARKKKVENLETNLQEMATCVENIRSTLPSCCQRIGEGELWTLSFC